MGHGSGETKRLARRRTRLRTRAQLGYVRTHGRRRAGKYCVVSVAAPQDGRSRVAIIVSKRYSVKAVVRNRARRLLREAYRPLRPDMKPAWLVLIPRRALQDTKLDGVRHEMAELLGSLGQVGAGGNNDEMGSAR